MLNNAWMQLLQLSKKCDHMISQVFLHLLWVTAKCSRQEIVKCLMFDYSMSQLIMCCWCYHVDKSQLNVVFEPVICMLQFQRAMLSQDIDSIRHWYVFQHIKDNTDMLTRLKTWFSNGIMVKIYDINSLRLYKPINKKDYEVWIDRQTCAHSLNNT